MEMRELLGLGGEQKESRRNLERKKETSDKEK